MVTGSEDDVALHTDRLLFELSVPEDEDEDGGAGRARARVRASAAGSTRAAGFSWRRWRSCRSRRSPPRCSVCRSTRCHPGHAGLASHSAAASGPPVALRGVRAGHRSCWADPAHTDRGRLSRAGLWHLPGGGTDPGEQPAAGLLRELVEEGGQLGRVVELLGVNNLHNPAALGPEGRPLDWHGVRVIYRVLVDVPTDAVVTESVGGSTARAAWFTRAQAVELPLSDIAAAAIGQSGR
ncbi:NUDIX domain-containing protein [Micromonospora sp. M12]